MTMPRWKQLRARLPAFLLLCAMLAGWAAWNIRSFDLANSSGPCGLQEVDHGNHGEELYSWFLRQRFATTSESDVVVVTLSSKAEPLSVLSNVCEGREFMALLLPALYKAKEIAIDKFYSDKACPATDDANDHLSQAVQNIPASIPFVVGQAAHPKPLVPGEQEDDCLVETPKFRFGEDAREGQAGQGGKVVFGLTRLNENTLQIPLAWPVFETERSTKTRPEPGFAFQVASHTPAPHFKDDYLQRLVQEESQSHHPFAILRPKLDEWSAMDIVCSTPGQTIYQGHYKWECPAPLASKPNLQGKVVVVGEQVSTDLQPFPGKKEYGVNLQAKYVDALLQKRYLREVPYWLDWVLAGLAVVLFASVDLTLGSLFKAHPTADEPIKDAKRELAIVAFGFGVLVLLSLFNAFLIQFPHYYAPICLLSLYPLGLYFSFRAVWVIFTSVRDLKFPSQEHS